MNKIMNVIAMKQSFSRLWFFHLAIVLIWLKTHIVQRYVFNLPIKGWYQEIIVLISPISAILFMAWLALILSRKWKNGAILAVSFITSSILFCNVWYYRFFNDFVTLPVLFQTENAADLGNSALTLLQWTDLLFFSDFFILLAIARIRKLPSVSLKPTELSTMFVATIVIFLVNLGMAETVRPDLLTRTFDRNILVKSIGTYNYHVYDFILSSRTKTQRAFATSDGLLDVEKYVKEKPAAAPQPPIDLFGIAKNKNIILISIESVQSFVIDNTLYGQEITPFMNDLIKESYYFDEFYHQTGQGKTSDAEFIIDNSLYPLPSGAVYFTHASNEYNSTAKILKKYGYYSASFHANDSSFWNRENMYDNLGYDRFFSKSDYAVNEENSISWGLKDISFFEQSVEHLKLLPQPFYGKLITLTNHHPFILAEEDKLIPEFDSADVTVNRYFTTVRYTDEALKVFFERMKQSGLYDNSIFILYGDHYGISGIHKKALARFLGREINQYEQIQLQRVPLIIHIPGMEGKRISKVSGQIDIRPTMLHLLGIEGENKLDFGENLFVDNPDPLIVLRDGSFITEDYVYTENLCYKKGFVPSEADESLCVPYKETAEADLGYSDKIIYGDLMRFSGELEERTEGEQLQNQRPYSLYYPYYKGLADHSVTPNEVGDPESEAELESREAVKSYR